MGGCNRVTETPPSEVVLNPVSYLRNCSAQTSSYFFFLIIAVTQLHVWGVGHRTGHRVPSEHVLAVTRLHGQLPTAPFYPSIMLDKWLHKSYKLNLKLSQLQP